MIGNLAGHYRRHISRRTAVLGILAALLLGGCDYYSPNLGVAPTQASAVSSISPPSATVGTPGLTLTVNGAGFVNGSTVLWNWNNSSTTGQPLATTYVNEGQLTATITAEQLAAQGTASIGVIAPGRTTNNTAGDNLSNFIPFTVAAPGTTAPTLSQISPNNATVGGPDFTMTLTGTGFLSNSTVFWSGINCLNPNDPTTCINNVSTSGNQITAEVPAGFIATIPTIQPKISVYTPGGGTTGSLPFTITSVQSSLSRAGALAISAMNTHSPAIAAGSRFLAFVAPSSDSVAPVNEVFVRDTCAGAPTGCTPQTTLVSVSILGSGPDGNSGAPSISSNGRFVAFASEATDLVPSDSNGFSDIFLRDTCIGAPSGCTPSTTLLSLAMGGGAANGPSISPSLSSDGRYVAFDSAATNLVGDLSGASTAAGGSFLRDTCFGAPSGCVPSTTQLPVSTPTAP